MSKQTIGKIRLKVGDEVVVISGKHKPIKKNGELSLTEGKVKSINRQTGYGTVENVNMVKKAVKPTQNKEGGIIEMEGKIHLSNLMKKEAFNERRKKVEKHNDKPGT